MINIHYKVLLLFLILFGLSQASLTHKKITPVLPESWYVHANQQTEQLKIASCTSNVMIGLDGCTANAQEQPNILFISIDGLRPQLGAYGEQQMITPNLDAQAASGRLFKRHYVQVPSCGASRACLLTGKNVTQRSHINHLHLANSLKGTAELVYPETFIHHLKRNGYYTVGMGKISHSDNGHQKYGGKSVLELPHSWDKFINDKRSPWGGGGLHAYANGKLRIKGEDPAYEFLNVPDDGYPDGWIANSATKQLEELVDSEEPFFMAVGFYKPHSPFCAPKKYWDMYEHEDIKISPNPDLPEGVSPVFLHNSVEFFGQYNHPEQGGAGKRISDDYARNVIHANYASTTYTDAQVGKVLQKLKELNLDENTIVIVWGDHGWHLGDHTIWGKHNKFDKALNSTLIIKTPKMKKAGMATSGLVATIDLYLTICELAGVPTPKNLDGKSITNMLNKPEANGKDAVMSYWKDILSMRIDQYRLAVFSKENRQEVMLFDHWNDSNETQNIAAQNPKIVDELLIRMKELNKDFLPHLK